MNVYSWALARIAARWVAPVAIRRPSRAGALRLLALGVVVAIVATVYFLRDQLDVSNTGYPLIAALSLLGSAGMVVPVPGMASVCAGGILLNPLLVGLLAGSTETIGELTGYALGSSGRVMFHRSRLYARIEDWMKRRGWLVLFVLSVVPNPIFDFAGVAAGALRFPIWRFLAVIWPGKLIKFLAISYLCNLGAGAGLLRFFGISPA